MPNPEVDPAQWVALSLIPALGKRTIERLIERFGTIDNALHAPPDALMSVSGIGPVLAEAIRAVDLEETRRELAAWQAGGIAVLLPGHGAYPARLRDLPDAPATLFCRGALVGDDERAIAIVGTRRPTPAARDIARTLGKLLAARGWTIVSGLAYGIDALAHRAALLGGGRTIAVLGSGVNVVYPPANQALARAVIANGALLSELHPGAHPSSATLVARNRIITGLSRAVIVIEAGERSGSLHAARFARQQGRPVFTPDCDAPGNRLLLDEGAHVLPVDASRWASAIEEVVTKG